MFTYIIYGGWFVPFCFVAAIEITTYATFHELKVLFVVLRKHYTSDMIVSDIVV